MRLPLTLSLIVILATGPAWAGIEPSPFQPEINQLRAQENSMLAHFGHLEWVLGFDPTPFQPVVNQLNTVAKQLAKRDAKIFGIVDPIVDPSLGIPPSDIMPALEDLDILAGAIHQRALEGFGLPPNDQRVLDALATVEFNARELQLTIQDYLPALETDYTVRFYYDPAITVQEVMLELFTWPGPCAAYEPNLTGDWATVTILPDPETGTFPGSYSFDVEEGVEITFAYATAFGTVAMDEPWQFTACGDAVGGVIDIIFDPPGS